jgi:hypothetical protein
MKAEILAVMGKTPLNSEVIRDKIFKRFEIFYQVDTISRQLRSYNEVVAIPHKNKGSNRQHNRWRIA